MGSFNSLQTTTIREFSGGLNVVTDDLNMNTTYSTIETNIYNNINGTKSIRYGTKLFTNFTRKITKYYENVPITVISEYDYKFAQPTSNRVPVGTYVSVYQNSTDSEPIVNGVVYLSNKDYFYIKSYSANVTISGTVYISFYKLDILQDKIETTFANNGKTIRSQPSLNVSDVPEIVNLSIGQKVTIYTANNDEVIFKIKTKSNSTYMLQKFSGAEDISTSGNYKVRIILNNITGTRFVNCTYFLDRIIAVTNKGEVCTIDGTGNLVVIFDAGIANFINTTNPGGWSTNFDTASVCFAVFNGILTIWNGMDKPLAVDLLNESQIYCNYLYDAATMSNDNVPIAKYAIGFNHYLVAGNVWDDLEQKQVTDRLCISAKDAIGTFYTGLSTDVDNDAVNIDLGTVTSNNSLDIKGLSRYRNQLVVGFDDATVFGTLGDYIETQQEIDGEIVTIKNHNPKFEDVIDKFGCISNRTYTNVASNLLCLDYSGVSNFNRRNVVAAVTSSRISEIVSPEIYKNYNNLSISTIENRIFSINNPKENQYLLFIPNNNDYALTTETVCYAYTLNSKTSNIYDGAWSKFTGWNFDCGCTSALNTVFLCKGLKIYTLGNIDNPYHADYIDDPDYPPLNEEDSSGVAINFTWELPWTDFGDRAAIKKSRYIALSTTGKAYFTVDMFIDYIYTNKETGLLDPNLSMNFVAGDAYGYGDGNNYTVESSTIYPVVVGNQYYGGSRRTNSEFLFAWTTKFKIAKFRINGSSKFKLNINSLTFYYQRGNIRR